MVYTARVCVCVFSLGGCGESESVKEGAKVMHTCVSLELLWV